MGGCIFGYGYSVAVVSALVIGSLLKSSRSNPLLLLVRHPAECVLARPSGVREGFMI